MPVADEFLKGAELVADQLYFVHLRRLEQARTSRIAASNICFSIDNELIYEPFCADFGPLNLGQTYRFCQRIRHLLQIAKRQHQKIYFYSSSNEQFKANAAVLAGAFQIIYLDRSAEEAYKPLRQYEPYPAFRDASCLPPTFILTVFHCLQGIHKAKEVGFIDWNLDPAAFNVEEYEAFERVEGGDLNWVVPRKLLAFAGPSAKRTEVYGYRTHVPEDYIKYFKSKGISAVVRLNKKVYDRRRFTTAGFNHHELFFPDGSCPPVSIVKEFLKLCDQEDGALAVHCKAGLGRTGVLICCYIMRTYRFTAEEALGYIRVCRPGSVIGPQQNFIKEMQPFAWNSAGLDRSESASKSAKTSGQAERIRNVVKSIPNEDHLSRRPAWTSASIVARDRDPVTSLENRLKELKLGSGMPYASHLRQPGNRFRSGGYGVIPDALGPRVTQGAASRRSTSASGRSPDGFSAQQRVTRSSSGAMGVNGSSSLSYSPTRIHTGSSYHQQSRGLAPNGQPRKGAAMGPAKQAQNIGRSVLAARSTLIRSTSQDAPPGSDSTFAAAARVRAFRKSFSYI